MKISTVVFNELVYSNRSHLYNLEIYNIMEASRASLYSMILYIIIFLRQLSKYYKYIIKINGKPMHRILLNAYQFISSTEKITSKKNSSGGDMINLLMPIMHSLLMNNPILLINNPSLMTTN